MAADTLLPTGSDVLTALGWPTTDSELLTLADDHAQRVAVLAKAYTRGRGFNAHSSIHCEADVAAVIVSAASRSVSNPTQSRRIEAGSFNSSPTPFVGWSLIEATVLNRYRRRQS